MKRLAITGGAASGKSTLLRYLREQGVATASADDVARLVYDDPAIQSRLAEILGVPQPVPRHLLLQAILDDPSVRRSVNAAMHDAVWRQLELTKSVVWEVPLLIEACLQGSFERVWVADCGADEQRRRLFERLGDADLVERLIATQLPARAKVAFADEVIRTNRPEPLVRAYVLELFERERTGLLG